MHRLITLAAALAVLCAVPAAVPDTADAQQRRKQVKPPQQPRIILRDRQRYGPPQQQPDRHYYGPPSAIQPPMERVPMPPPLAQPPINR